MSVETSDPYEAVITDLKAKRDHIDQTIAALEMARNYQIGMMLNKGANTTILGSAVATPAVDEPGAFLGLSIPDATKKLLAAKKRPLTNSEIAQFLKAGGMMMSSADPNNTIGSIVTRRANAVGDIVKVDRGVWGLREWYPTRQFKSAKTGSDTKLSASPTEPEPPSDQPADAAPVSGHSPEPARPQPRQRVREQPL